MAKDKRDFELFTATILLLSSIARIAREEIDGILGKGAARHRDKIRLLNARRRFAALAAIADHYDD